MHSQNIDKGIKKQITNSFFSNQIIDFLNRDDKKKNNLEEYFNFDNK